ncbi:hypothetical protein B566_EDAN004198 [Ephemera danica]|nr:hypothetical protein B566_EDAN004198 [Ephemera danica]
MAKRPVMMSNILEKTFGSIFNANDHADNYSCLHGLFKKCISSKTRKEEAMVIQHHLSLMRERLKEPSIRPNFVGHCLAFVVFADILGYPAEFAHIHAINLAQQSSLPDKKMGYTASCCLLKEGHELCLLLVNTLVRDLASSNVAVIGMALTALCSAPLPPDACPTLLPALRDRLAHQTVSQPAA